MSQNLSDPDSPASTARDAVIVGGARTPFTRLKGGQASLRAADLGAAAIRGALQRSKIDVQDIDSVIMGQVVQAGAGQNPARQSALAAGIGWEVPAVTINKVCLSGLTAIIDAGRLIKLGEADVVVAGGQESMTNAPHVLPGSRNGFKYGTTQLLDTLARDGLTEAQTGQPMGELTEEGNVTRMIDRVEQDKVAVASHQRAAKARNAGTLTEEIFPIQAPQLGGNPVLVTEDEGIRPEATSESLGTLLSTFAANGAITAGNSSPLTDGAAAVVVTSRAYAERNDLHILAALGAAGQVAGPDSSLHSQPSRAIAAALKKASWPVADLDFIEINEAFGAVVFQSLKDLAYPLERTNINGGAIALGHPIGASGARIVLTAAMELDRRGIGRAAVGLCGGGGQGEALLLSR